jgi:transcriptional regulator with XRE-family HTH domain
MKKRMAKILGARLKEARTHARVSQAHVAAELDVTRQSVSAWETGLSAPTAIQLAQLSAVYCVDAHVLLFGEPFKPVLMDNLMPSRKVPFR